MEPTVVAKRWIGEPMRRREDDALVRGAARFVDDLRAFDGLADGEYLAMAVVRSPMAHARILGVDASAALALPGVDAVVTARDLDGSVAPFPSSPPQFGAEIASAPVTLLATGAVRYVGEPVAVVLARSKAEAEDGAELVALDLDPLRPVVTLEDARRGVAILHETVPGNVLARWHHRSGDVEVAFATAAHVARCRARIPRLAAAPMEVRTCVVAHDELTDVVTLWASAQDPWRQADQLGVVLGRPREKIRVVIPAVGGAFGAKGALVPEYGVAAWCAIHFATPVRWFEDRSENFLSSYQGRGVEADIELALDGDGRITGLRAEVCADLGAYLYPSSANVAVTTATLMTGCYAIPAVEVRLEGMATTKVPTGPYRGAGRPEATFFIERAVDVAAGVSGIDPVELRRRNLVDKDAFPYANGLGLTYDSGDYLGSLEAACELLDYERTRAEHLGARRLGRLVGVGVASCVERAAPAVWESAEVTLAHDGTLVARLGSTPQGQGHETTFAQIAADRLGLEPGQVEIRHGDSAAGPWGVGTFGSRSVTLGGSALVLACDDLLGQLRRVAAGLLESEEAAVAYDAGCFTAPGRGSVDLAAVGAEAQRTATTLRAEHKFAIERPVFSFGTYGAVVEIDPDTGKVSIRRLVAVDDAGTVINPFLAEGQVIGSTVQGIGAVLYEEVIHDDDGQPLSSSFISYGLASAPDLDFEFTSAFRCTPSPLNPLGAKGLGEAGTIGAPAAIANAVIDALAQFGVTHLDPPYAPERIWRVIDAGRAAGSDGGTARG